MAKQQFIKQFVIKPDTEDYTKDTDFCTVGNENRKISKLSIWTVPDIKFTINNSPDLNNRQESTIMTNRTGMYEIDLTDLGVITSLKFATKNDYFKAKNSFCYIDILYTKEDEQ